MNTRTALIAAAFTLSFSQSVTADDDLWFGVKAGTLGVGIEATYRALPYLDFRAGYNGYSHDDTFSEAGIDYDGELDLSTVYATANLRVPLSPFRITAGVFSNGNEILLNSQDTGSFEIGGMTYQASDVGTLEARGSFDSFAPYAGVGFDFRIANKVGLSLDAGVLFQGAAEISMAASGPISSDPVFMQELEAERQELQDSVDDYEYYPVVSLGFTVNF